MARVCKEDEIINPKTNRCVKRAGKIGRALVEKLGTTVVATTTAAGLYIPSYLRKQEKPKTLKEYIHEQNPSAPAPNTRFIRRFIDMLLQEVMDTTLQCVWYYRRNRSIKKDDVMHTLGMLGIGTEDKKEDKELTTIVRRLVQNSVGNDVRMEPSVYPTLSRVVLPFTTMAPSQSFLENLKTLQPSSRIENLSLRFVS